MNACCNRTDEKLDRELEQTFPASDPPTLTEAAGDARDAAGCCCGPKPQDRDPDEPAGDAAAA